MTQKTFRHQSLQMKSVRVVKRSPIVSRQHINDVGKVLLCWEHCAGYFRQLQIATTEKSELEKTLAEALSALEAAQTQVVSSGDSQENTQDYFNTLNRYSTPHLQHMKVVVHTSNPIQFFFTNHTNQSL